MAKYFLGERAAAAVRQLMRGDSSVGSVPGAVGEPVDVKSFADPFTVQWSETDGAWLVWLPDLSSLCYYQDASQTIPAPGASSKILGEGWYIVPDGVIGNGGTLYLSLIVNDETKEVDSVGWTGEPPSSTTGTTVYSAAICTVSTDDVTKERKVKQFVVSAIRFGGSGEGGGSGYVDVVTDVQFELADGDVPYSKKLVAKITKKRVSGVAVAALADDTRDVADVQELSVVESSEYNVSTHQFVNTKKKVWVIGSVADNDELVFQATPHSAEHPGGVQ